MQRKEWLALFIFLLLFNASACGIAWRIFSEDPRAMTAADSPLSLEPRSVDLGALAPGETREFEVVLVNRGDTRLELQAVRADCACTDVSLQRQTLDGQESTVLRGTIRGRQKAGTFESRLWLATKPPEQQRWSIVIRGVITPEILVSPESVTLTPNESDSKPATRQVVVENRGRTHVNITGMSKLPASIKVEGVPDSIEPGGTARLFISAIPGQQAEELASLYIRDIRGPHADLILGMINIVNRRSAGRERKLEGAHSRGQRLESE